MNDTTFQGNGKIAYVPVVVNAKPPKPTTNADRIRSMSDEELAEFLMVVGGCGPYHDQAYCKSRPRCEDNCWLDWLKQEVSTNG